LRAPGRSAPATSRSISLRAGAAAGSLGLPDLGISNLDDVLIDVRRNHRRVFLPLLVDRRHRLRRKRVQIKKIARSVKSLIKAGAAGMHIEDQVGASAAAIGPAKELVSQDEMVDRVKAAVDAKTDPDFVGWRAPTLSPWKARARHRARPRLRRGRGGRHLPEAMTELSMYRIVRRCLRCRSSPTPHRGSAATPTVHA